MNIVFTCSQHHESLPPLPPSPPAITPTHSRLRRLARTSGGSVSGLLPTRRRCRTRRRAPPGPAALSPGSDRQGGGPDRWRLRRRARTGGSSVSGLLYSTAALVFICVAPPLHDSSAARLRSCTYFRLHSSSAALIRCCMVMLLHDSAVWLSCGVSLLL